MKVIAFVFNSKRWAGSDTIVDGIITVRSLGEQVKIRNKSNSTDYKNVPLPK